MNIKIRKANSEDKEKIIEFLKLVDKDLTPPLSERKISIEESIDKNLKNKDADLISAFADSKIVGFLHSKKNWRKTEYAMILTVVVHPEYRGRGVGKLLLNYIINKLKKEKVKGVYITTYPKHEVAIKLYPKLGFRLIKIEKDYKNLGNKYHFFMKLC